MLQNEHTLSAQSGIKNKWYFRGENSGFSDYLKNLMCRCSSLNHEIERKDNKR